MTPHISRRTVVRGAALASLGTVTGAAGVLTAGPAAAAPAASPATAPASAKERVRSANGWAVEKQANKVSAVWTRPVPGTGLTLDVRTGEVETILVHLVRRYHYEVDELRPGDLTGWRRPADVDLHAAESNLASGTAVRVRPGFYPAGTTGGYFPAQLAVLRDILAELDGVVRWGGDDDRRPDESLFFVDVAPGDSRLTGLVAKLRGWSELPGHGAGGPLA